MVLKRAAAAAVALLGVVLGGCQTEMIPTPYVMYGEAGRTAFEAVPPGLRTPEAPVIYVTDRVADKVGPEGPEYGYRRSPELTFGTATVTLGEGATWDSLVADSTTDNRSGKYHPRVTKVEPAGAIGAVPARLVAVDGRLRLTKEAVDEFHATQAKFDGLIARWAEGQERRDAVVFVHGYNNKFDDAVLRLAQAWHAGGRAGIPIVYTWPAGSGGLTGYAYDRESGEYTIVHLKLLLATLIRSPHVDRIHIISHSRGTDVAVTALRELNAEVRGAVGAGLVAREIVGKGLFDPTVTAPPPTYEYLKLETLILAAPDLDLEVFVQRFFGENLLQAARRTLVYFSDEDEALGMADWLFRSRRRLGALRLVHIPEPSRKLFASVPAIELINAEVTGFTSHSYILQHPAALSNVILVLRDGKLPGPENGRPMKRIAESIWQIDNSYCQEQASIDAGQQGGAGR
ncbi:MAG: alpha/beta hydrolase [Planctomycetota bacterium]|nr:alpha/beta hydrolase [Planctomycetota bacterium]